LARRTAGEQGSLPYEIGVIKRVDVLLVDGPAMPCDCAATAVLAKRLARVAISFNQCQVTKAGEFQAQCKAPSAAEYLDGRKSRFAVVSACSGDRIKSKHRHTQRSGTRNDSPRYLPSLILERLCCHDNNVR